MKKRGISPLLATVSLVLFVVLVIAIVFFWTKKVQEQAVEKNAELSRKQLECDSVTIEVEARDGRIMVTNRGSIDIDGFVLREEFGLSGDVRVSEPREVIAPGQSYTLIKGNDVCDASKAVVVPGTLCSQTTKVVIEPALKPEGRGAPLVPCPDASETVRV
ncbi:MAG: hypothetical protein AABW46_03065 [Nanoarchaeota archaeon]